MFNTEYKFTLPKGYIDENGTVHRDGIMRLATAADEILPMKDSRVKQNPDYLTVMLLSRVVTKLGTLPVVDTLVIEKLFTVDLAFLQDMYQQINETENQFKEVCCPHCGQTFKELIKFS